MSPLEDSTADFQRQKLKSFADTFFAKDGLRLTCDVGANTHQGKVRQQNEDHYAVITRERKQTVSLTNLPSEQLSPRTEKNYVLIVADGIGGGPSGDFASQLAIMTMWDLGARAKSWMTHLTPDSAVELGQRVEAYLEQIQNSFREYASLDSELAGMGTTWTSAIIGGEYVCVVYLGDSRAYLLHDGQLKQLTKDQTLGEELKQMGAGEEEVSRFSHVLTNNLGNARTDPHAVVTFDPIQAGDRILVCTDGLTDMVSDGLIAAILGEGLAPQETCDKLIHHALEAGGKDNVSVIVADVKEA